MTVLAAAGRAQEATTVSSSGTPTSVTFQNDSGEQRHIYWLDFDGERVLYRRLESGERLPQPTQVTHAWLVADTDGACLSIHQPIDEPGFVQLQ